MPHPVGLFVVVALVPGCAVPGAGPGASTRDGATPHAKDGIGPVDFSGMVSAGWGQGFAVFFESPRPVGSPPPGWERPPPARHITVQRATCQQLTEGPLERGPVSIQLESHQNFEVPPGCQDATTPRIEVLSNLFVDDADVASYLREQWGLPAVAADIPWASSTVNDVREVAVTWQPAGHNASSLRVTQGRFLEPALLPSTLRLVWYNETSMWYGDQHTEALTNWLAAQGNLAEPMLYHEVAGTPHYLSDGAVVSDVEFSARFVEYGDNQCALWV